MWCSRLEAKAVTAETWRWEDSLESAGTLAAMHRSFIKFKNRNRNEKIIRFGVTRETNAVRQSNATTHSKLWLKGGLPRAGRQKF